MRLRAGRKAVTVAIGALAAALVAGTAYAYWSASGTGTGTASASSVANLTTSAATVTGTLFPGGTSTGAIVVSNSNPFVIKITSAAFGAAIVSTQGLGTCTITGVTFAPTTAPSSANPLTVPAKTNGINGTVTLNYTAAMDNTSDNGCQGAGFSSTVTLSGQS